LNILWGDGHVSSMVIHNPLNPYVELTSYSSSKDGWWDRK
jgi:hypothetical protein